MRIGEGENIQVSMVITRIWKSLFRWLLLFFLLFPRFPCHGSSHRGLTWWSSVVVGVVVVDPLF